MTTQIQIAAILWKNRLLQCVVTRALLKKVLAGKWRKTLL
jgi:hypothetical protein